MRPLIFFETLGIPNAARFRSGLKSSDHRETNKMQLYSIITPSPNTKHPNPLRIDMAQHIVSLIYGVFLGLGGCN